MKNFAAPPPPLLFLCSPMGLYGGGLAKKNGMGVREIFHSAPRQDPKWNSLIPEQIFLSLYLIIPPSQKVQTRNIELRGGMYRQIYETKTVYCCVCIVPGIFLGYHKHTARFTVNNGFSCNNHIQCSTTKTLRFITWLRTFTLYQTRENGCPMDFREKVIYIFRNIKVLFLATVHVQRSALDVHVICKWMKLWAIS